MRLLSIDVSAIEFSARIRLAPPESAEVEEANWVTAIIGENGSKKSLILRLIAGSALGQLRYRARGYPEAHAKVEITGGKKGLLVIAMSGTATDRFPATVGLPVGARPSSFDGDFYRYFGPHQGVGVDPRVRQVSTFVYLLLSNGKRALSRGQSVAKVLGKMDFGPRVEVRLIPAGRGIMPKVFEVDEVQWRKRDDFVRTRAARVDGWLSSSEGLYNGTIRKYASALVDDPDMLRYASRLSAQTWRVKFSFDADSYDEFVSDSLPWSELAQLLAIGVLRVDDVVFSHSQMGNGLTEAVRKISVDGLSSGQWHVLLGLINLALAVEDDSLILIDEPENSLHPEWQRSYVDMLQTSLGGVRGCHAVMATHSPLIAAGIDGEAGNVLVARKDADGGTKVEDIGSVYAWRPDDVLRDRFDLDSTRAPELQRVADRLLSLIGNSADEPVAENEMSSLLQRLAMFSEVLPDEDPLVPALNRLMGIAVRRYFDSPA